MGLRSLVYGTERRLATIRSVVESRSRRRRNQRIISQSYLNDKNSMDHVKSAHHATFYKKVFWHRRAKSQS